MSGDRKSRAAGLPKIVPLDRPVPEVIADLEGLLERAREGEIVAIAWGLMLRGGDSQTGWTTYPDAMAFIGVCSRLVHRLHLQQDEESGDAAG